MYNTTDSPPKSEGGTASGNLRRKVQQHIKKIRDKKKIHQMSARLDDLIQFGPFSLGTAKRVFQGLAEGAEHSPLVRPKGLLGSASSYVPHWEGAEQTSAYGKYAYNMGNLKPGSTVVPRGVNDPLATAMHERGHASDPGLQQRMASTEKSVGDVVDKGGLFDPGTLAKATTEQNKGLLQNEQIANKRVLSQVQQHGTPGEVQGWKQYANQQMKKGYRSPFFSQMTQGKSLGEQRQIYKSNPWIQSSTTDLSCLLDELIQFTTGSRIL